MTGQTDSKLELELESMAAARKAGGKVRVAIVGARGYTGLELARLLLRHPQVELAACFATAAFSLSDSLHLKAAASVPGLAIDELLPMAASLDYVFLATPAPTSMELAPQLLELGVNVIDLSGAFRLAEGDVVGNYQDWYAMSHTTPTLVQEAEYGLVPWIQGSGHTTGLGAKLVSNPGCFATAILMGLLPLLKNGVIREDTLTIDAKSGTTGAGKKAEERLLHAEVDGGCFPYRIGRHQHLPEICQSALALSGVAIDPHFTTHLLNIRRGIIAGLYAKVVSGVTSAQVGAAFTQSYAHDPLVEVIELTNTNESTTLNLRRVVGTGRTRIAYRLCPSSGGDKLYVFALIDNLMKGAATQAIENFNRLIGQPTWTTLVEMEGVI